MIEDITLRAFDLLVNPVIVCETSGKVIFKNTEAVRRLPKPSRGGNVNSYLEKESRKRFESGAAFPGFFDFNGEAGFESAFADVVYYERRPVVLLLFSHLFLYRPAMPLFRKAPQVLKTLTSGEKIIHLATDLYTSESMVKAARDRTMHRKTVQIFHKIVNAILTEFAYGRSEIHVLVNYTLDILLYACNKVLSHLGLDIIFENNYTDGDMMMLDYKPFTLFASSFILFATEISQGHLIYADVSQDSEDDSLHMSFKVETGKRLSTVSRGGTGSFAELLPGRSLDLYFFGLACKESAYRFSFSLSPKEKYDLTMRLATPTYIPLTLREESPITKKKAYAFIDALLPKLLAEEGIVTE